MRTTNDPGQALRLAAWVTGTATLSLFALTAVARINQVSPKVGDIVQFEQMPQPQPETGARLLVHRSGQFGCVMDLDVLHRLGGSLIVESKLDTGPDTWRLHWAGERTSSDTADCGTATDLILSSADIRILSAAAFNPRD